MSDPKEEGYQEGYYEGLTELRAWIDLQALDPHLDRQYFAVLKHIDEMLREVAV